MHITGISFHCDIVYCGTVIGNECDIFPTKHKLHTKTMHHMVLTLTACTYPRLN